MVTLWAGILLAVTAQPAQPGKSLTLQARAALRKGVEYLVSISTGGGYLWEYTVDLKQRWGEGEATDSQIWVQPPGTPTIGEAFLRAYESTGDPYFLRAAEAAGDALVWGQLQCGGWAYFIDFSEEGKRKFFYAHLESTTHADRKKLRNYGTLDDNTSQSAISFLIRLSLISSDETFKRAAQRGLKWLVDAQAQNGAWPQVYPPTGSGYWNFYTFNDGAINDAIRVLLEAWRAYGDSTCLQAAKRGGDFILLSQGPPEQPAWAQQYDFDLKPAWARKFEPAAWCSAVVARNIRTLVDLYLETGEEKYLKPIPPAIEWLERSRLSDNQWARFYELGTNRPLYFTKQYQLTYDDSDCPTHYSFKGEYGIPSAVNYYREVVRLGRDGYLEKQAKARSAQELRRKALAMEAVVRDIIARQDEVGRWATAGRVKMADAARNLGVLADYLEGMKGSDDDTR